jgi:hypothetical protein
MSEREFIDVLRRMRNESVKVRIRPLGTDVYHSGYIVEVGSDYILMRESLDKKTADRYFQLALITHIATEWKN